MIDDARGFPTGRVFVVLAVAGRAATRAGGIFRTVAGNGFRQLSIGTRRRSLATRGKENKKFPYKLSTAVVASVTVTATDSDAAEAGPDPGVFTVTRTGDTTNALTVNFTVGGTAAAGSDYGAIGTSVLIPGGASSETITITPIADTLNEASETVKSIPVRLGRPLDGERIEVEGLQAGTRIVVAGARSLREGQKVRVLGDEAPVRARARLSD